MDYKNLIDPELRKSAHRYPFNKGVVIGGNIYQTAEWRFIKTPSEVEEKEIVLQGHNGLSFKTSVFTPKEAGNNIPALLYVHGGAFSYKAAGYQEKAGSDIRKDDGMQSIFPALSSGTEISVSCVL